MNRLGERKDELSPVLNVANRSLIPRRGQLLVDDVGVHHHHFHRPEEHFAPPLDRLVEEAVVADELIHLFNTQHMLIVVEDGLGLLGCCSRWPE